MTNRLLGSITYGVCQVEAGGWILGGTMARPPPFGTQTWDVVATRHGLASNEATRYAHTHTSARERNGHLAAEARGRPRRRSPRRGMPLLADRHALHPTVTSLSLWACETRSAHEQAWQPFPFICLQVAEKKKNPFALPASCTVHRLE